MELAATFKAALLGARFGRASAKDPSDVQQPPRLVLRFAVSTAVLLALGAFAILIFVRQHAISQAESAGCATHGS